MGFNLVDVLLIERIDIFSLFYAAEDLLGPAKFVLFACGFNLLCKQLLGRDRRLEDEPFALLLRVLETVDPGTVGIRSFPCDDGLRIRVRHVLYSLGGVWHFYTNRD